MNILRFNQFILEDKILFSNYDIISESRLITEINYLINEGKFDWIKRIVIKVFDFFKKTKEVTQNFIVNIINIVEKIIRSLTPEKRNKFDKAFQKFKNQLSENIKFNLQKEEINNIVENSLEKAKELGLIDIEDLKKSFEMNKDKIMKLIKENISQSLESNKEKILEEIEEINTSVDQTFTSGTLKNLKSFTVGSSFMLVFGFIDNFAMFVGMDAIEQSIINMGFDSQIAAGIGNTFSDAVGVLFGGAIGALLYKVLKVKGEGTFAQQLVGVVVGCLIPVIFKMIMMLI